MTMVSRVDAYQRRHRWAGLPLAVLYKFADDQGTYLAAQITYYGLVAVFPLLLLLATILGYALRGNQHLQRQVLDSALAQFPVIGDQITANIHSLHGSAAGLGFTTWVLDPAWAGRVSARRAAAAVPLSRPGRGWSRRRLRRPGPGRTGGGYGSGRSRAVR
jgi:uncharacterized BrkB/YihY/UPF0761 family membrane protein